MANQTQALNDKAKRNPYLKTSLKYPLDVETEGQGHIILFNINVVSGTKFANTTSNIQNPGPVVQRPGSNSLRSRTSLDRNTKRIDTSIALHLPLNLTFNYMQDWSESEMGAAARAYDFVSNWDQLTLSQVWESFKTSGGNILASMLQQLSPINARDLLDFERGQIKNPYKELLFGGTKNRAFNFQFKFTPRNAEETKQVKDICKQFKLHQAPEFVGTLGNAYILYPSEFDISFIKKDGTRNEWINKISTCALTSCEIIYGDEGGYQIHEDESPVEIALNLAFMEMEALSKARIEQEDF